MAGKRPKGGTLKEFQTIDGWNDKKLYPAELKLLHAARDGEECILTSERPKSPDKNKNLIRADFLRFLITGGDEEALVHDCGVRVRGAWIDCPDVYGQRGLDLESCTIRGDLVLFQCHLDGDLIALGCSAQSFILTGSSVEAISADGLETTGGVFLRDGFTAAGTVRFLGAKIGSNFDCIGAKLNGEAVALDCDGLETTGGVFLRNGFTAAGTVRFLGATIGGSFSCTGAKLKGEAIALHCDGLETTGDVFLGNGFTAAGTVRLVGATIGGDLACRGGRFNDTGVSIDCQGALVCGQGFFDSDSNMGDFFAFGTIDLTDAKFEKSLLFQEAILSCTEEAIIASGLKVGAELSFSGAQIAGPISITSATIDGDVTTNGTSFERGLAIERSKIGGILFWRNLKHFSGTLSLDQSTAGALSFEPKSWAKPHRIELDGFTYERFHNMPETCDAAYWVDRFLGQKRITVYYELAPETTGDGAPAAGPAADPVFRPHAHGQLAKVLAAMGHEEEARAVNIDKRRRLAASASQRFWKNWRSTSEQASFFEGLTLLWTKIVGLTIDHGYRPGKAVVWMAGIWVVCTLLVFVPARHAGIMTPTDPLVFKEAYQGVIPEHCKNDWNAENCREATYSEYSEFYAPVYSLDILLPIIDFRQQEDWAPRVVKPDGTRDWFGWTVRFIEWVETFLGWILSLLLVSGVTGIIRRD